VLSVPTDATITGVEVDVKAYGTYIGISVDSLYVQLSSNGVAVGNLKSTVLTPSPTIYPFGSSSDAWGITLTPAVVNSGLGILVYAQPNSYSVGSSVDIYANNLSITVYYTVPYSDQLQVTRFSFAVPSTSGVSGLATSFTANSTVAGDSVQVQLLKNGVAVGLPKVQALTTTPTTYPLGDGTDLWGSTWVYSDINNTAFGYEIQAVAVSGTVSVQNTLMTVYLTPGLSNFNYIKSYIQNNNQTYTLALDADGLMWQEDVTNNPDELSLVLSGVFPGSFAKSATMDNREHIVFSNLSIGTDRPRVYNGVKFDPLSQVGPGAPPVMSTTMNSTSAPIAVTHYEIYSGYTTFTFSTIATAPVVGSLYTIQGTGNVGFDGYTFSVLGTPAPSVTQFSVATSLATTGFVAVTAQALPTNNYNIASIKQDTTIPTTGYAVGDAQSFEGQIALLSAGPGVKDPGTVLTFYYLPVVTSSNSSTAENQGITNAFKNGYPCYVYITGAPIGNGTWLITGHGVGVPGCGVHTTLPYFTVAYNATAPAFQCYGGPGGTGVSGPGNSGTFQLTMATLKTQTPVVNLSAGAQIDIVGASPSSWNGKYTIVDTPSSGTYSIQQSQMLAGGVAIFWYVNSSGSLTSEQFVKPGNVVALSGLVNLLIFNTTGVVQDPSLFGSYNINTQFAVLGFPGDTPAQTSPTPENGQAITYGTTFLFDPGVNYAQTSAIDTIYGDYTAGTPPASLSVTGGALVPIGAGIRQAVCYFITENEYETQPSAPVIFTTTEDTNQIVCSDLPIGPPDTVGRGIAFTEAGQNGVPGANFYVIEEDVTTTVNDVTTTVKSTIINDNTTTSMAFSFTDDVLLNSREIDLQGDNLFNLIELGSCAWCVPYAQRMFYGLQLNKVNNFTNLTFDGGYLASVVQPLGWKINNSLDQTLLISTVTGDSLYIQNLNLNASGSSTGGLTTPVGLIWQSAYQDAYLVPIINTNKTYSVRVACSAPSGLTVGTLVIDLVNYVSGTGFTTSYYGQANYAPYGVFTVPLSSMTTNIAVFIGKLLTTAFALVPPGLVLRVYLAGAEYLADCEIDRIEVYDTSAPYLSAQVYGSYPGQPEAIDASSEGGIIDTSTENAQPCYGGFVMHDMLYLLKTSSMYSTQDNPNSEPGGWGLKEVSNRVGTCGINAYDVGEEWMVTACRSGIFGFNGGQPTKIMQELWNLWECINWDAGNTIVLRNDTVNKRMYCAIPLPTGPTSKTAKWLPAAPTNLNPTTPNVMLMLNYQGLATFEEMITSPEVHTTMFGSLAAVDMRRKWSIWNIATPDMEFIMQPDGESTPLYICNGIGTSKIYEFSQTQYSDDGVAINSLYVSYGFVNAAKAATLPIFGFHRKRYTIFQCAITGGQLTSSKATNAKIRMLPNTITPKYPYTVPVGIPLSDPVSDDFFRPINVAGNRMFVEVSTSAVGSWFNLSKMILTGKADPWSAINPTGGGNVGII